jgi:hypothetical protein
MRVLFGCAFMDEYTDEYSTEAAEDAAAAVGEKAPGLLRRTATKVAESGAGKFVGRHKLGAGIAAGAVAVGGTAAVLARRKKKREAAG